jgi:hypothetical protein
MTGRKMIYFNLHVHWESANLVIGVIINVYYRDESLILGYIRNFYLKTKIWSDW